MTFGCEGWWLLHCAWLGVPMLVMIVAPLALAAWALRKD